MFEFPALLKDSTLQEILSFFISWAFRLQDSTLQEIRIAERADMARNR